MVVKGFGVQGSTDWLGPGREQLLFVAGPHISDGIALSDIVRVWSLGHSAFKGLGLKHTQLESRCSQ